MFICSRYHFSQLVGLFRTNRLPPSFTLSLCSVQEYGGRNEETSWNRRLDQFCLAPFCLWLHHWNTWLSTGQCTYSVFINWLLSHPSLFSTSPNVSIELPLHLRSAQLPSSLRASQKTWLASSSRRPTSWVCPSSDRPLLEESSQAASRLATLVAWWTTFSTPSCTGLAG